MPTGPPSEADERALAKPWQPLRGLRDADGPDRDLVAEGERRRMLAVGAADARRRAMLARQLREPIEHGVEIAGDQGEGLPHLQDERGVGDVLGRGALVEERLQLLRQLLLHGLDERDGRHPGENRLIADLGQVERVRADRLDGRRERLGHQAEPGLGAGQGGFHAQHGGDAARGR